MSAKILATQIQLHTRLFNNALDNISDDSAIKRGHDNTNHIKFLAGHLLTSRMGYAGIAGQPMEHGYEKLFSKDEEYDDSRTYPPLEEIKNKWNEVSGSIESAVAGMDEATLNAAPPFETPVSDPTTAGCLAFMIHHEAYHIGQLGLLRKMAGQEAVKYS